MNWDFHQYNKTKCQHYLRAHGQSRQNQRKVQSLPKRMPAPTQEKIQNITSPQSLPPRGLCGTTRMSRRNKRNAKKCALKQK